ncbi:hypothetical protein PEP31012_03853 [Pandoraea eparura]|uniref:Uncharacterized protein n=1 Tax=Pandoraea eparura TaxID=2508291 RepID=A0A5E4XE62_9BURK|nr:hypothetical protein [Pandoraea eparura]VVE34563.1 hypothetical protein PEP31012_03853 [Pandoraea eparura]
MAKLGDVFRIKTKFGFAYFQFTKRDKLMGSLIRVFPNRFNLQEDEIKDLINSQTNFWIFFPVSAAEKQGIIEKILHAPIPDHSSTFPLFRNGIANSATGKVTNWWFWDGEKEWKVGVISNEQRKLPILAAWNDTLLIKRIEDGWLPEKDPR